MKYNVADTENHFYVAAINGNGQPILQYFQFFIPKILRHQWSLFL